MHFWLRHLWSHWKNFRKHIVEVITYQKRMEIIVKRAVQFSILFTIHLISSNIEQAFRLHGGMDLNNKNGSPIINLSRLRK